MSKINGGAAFPQLSALRTHDAASPHTVAFTAESIAGMSLRDYFAAKALDIAYRAEQLAPCGDGDTPTYKGIAARAYLVADAMLAERAK